MPQASTAAAISPAATGHRLPRLELARIRNAILLVVTLAVVFQLVIFFSTDNLAASALLLAGAFLGLSYSLDQQLLTEYPLSTLAILGYTVSYFVIPPLGQLVDFNSILHNLNHHILVWVYGVVGLLALLIAHYAYRIFSVFGIARWSLVNVVYRPLRFFEMPDALQFWLMGFIGIAATIINIRLSHGKEAATLTAVMRVFRPLIYVPYLMVFPNLLDPRYKPKRQPIRLSLIAYTVLVIAAAAMTNSRNFMFTGFASLGVLYGYRVLTGTTSPPRLTLRSSIILVLCVWIVSGPITNMAASVVVARKLKSSVSPGELAEATWGIYRSGIAVRTLESLQSRAFRSSRYNESYYDNIFLDRLGNVRYTDLSIDASQQVAAIGETSYFRKIQFDKVIAILPTPLIKALHLQIDKAAALSGSSEDFLYQLTTGSPVGGMKTGSPMVILSTTFGMMWPIYFVLISTALFVILDARNDVIFARDENGNPVSRCTILNPIVAGTFFAYLSTFTAFGPQDISAYLGLLSREWVELALVYACAFILTKSISSLMLGWIWRGENVPQRGA